MADIKTVIKQAYFAFNKRDMDGALALMVEGVSWPKASESGKIVGKEEIRLLDSALGRVRSPCRTACNHQGTRGQSPRKSTPLVKNLDGDILSDTEVVHVFHVDNGRIAAMDLGTDADTSSPSAAVPHRS